MGNSFDGFPLMIILTVTPTKQNTNHFHKFIWNPRFGHALKKQWTYSTLLEAFEKPNIKKIVDCLYFFAHKIIHDKKNIV
jgi:hypothetical protein